MRKRSRTLKLRAAKRDNYTCQKCKFEDKTGEKLEAHHIVPLYEELLKENSWVLTYR